MHTSSGAHIIHVYGSRTFLCICREVLIFVSRTQEGDLSPEDGDAHKYKDDETEEEPLKDFPAGGSSQKSVHCSIYYVQRLQLYGRSSCTMCRDGVATVSRID